MELPRQVRGDTLQVLDEAQAEWLTWAPAGTSNHTLWHAGHGLWRQDLMCVELLSGPSEWPESWAETFGIESRPTTIDEWPSRDEVRSRLQTQFGRMLELVDETPDGVLSETPTAFWGNRTAFRWIVYGLHDEAKHCGEMYVLSKLCRQPS
jgi:hypothetical protein